MKKAHNDRHACSPTGEPIQAHYRAHAEQPPSEDESKPVVIEAVAAAEPAVIKVVTIEPAVGQIHNGQAASNRDL